MALRPLGRPATIGQALRAAEDDRRRAPRRLRARRRLWRELGLTLVVCALLVAAASELAYWMAR